MRIFLPNSAHLANLEAFLRKCRFDKPTELHVRLHPRWVSVHPVAVALTAAAAAQVRQLGGVVTVGRASSKNHSLRYLAAMQLFKALGCEPPEKVRSHEPAGRFIPITQIRTSAELSNFIVEMVPLLHATKTEVQPIQYVISELVRNVIEHANSTTGAMICAQYYKARRRLALGVADMGVGIRESLSTNYTTSDDLSALKLALQPGVTGTTSGIYGSANNAGAGLFFTKGIACASDNLFTIYSGSGFFKLRRTPLAKRAKGIVIHADPDNDYHTEIADLPAWQGTVVGVDVSIDKGRTFAQFLHAIRTVFGIHRQAAPDPGFKAPRFA
jgi:anti-sigma regulatory factor (Ser/Thr protein kinase)